MFSEVFKIFGFNHLKLLQLAGITLLLMAIIAISNLNFQDGNGLDFNVDLKYVTFFTLT
jgi:hypothetical protein